MRGTNTNAITRDRGERSARAKTQSVHQRVVEQAAIQEGDASKLSSAARSISGTCIESPEEERTQHIAMVAAPRNHAARILISEESVIAIEPAFCLEERKEQKTRYVKQCELRCFRWRDARRQ